MARTAITLTPVAADVGNAYPTPTTADASNDHVLTPTVPTGRILLVVTHTAASEKDLTVVAGSYPPAIAAGQGDLVVPFAAGNSTPVVKTFVLSSGRFIQSDGTIHIDLETGFTGSIAAFVSPVV